MTQKQNILLKDILQEDYYPYYTSIDISLQEMLLRQKIHNYWHKHPERLFPRGDSRSLFLNSLMYNKVKLMEIYNRTSFQIWIDKMIEDKINEKY